MSEAHHRALERMYDSAPSNQGSNLQALVNDHQVELSMRVQPEMLHSAGAVSGSYIYKMLEDACFLVASASAEEFYVLTASFNVQHIGPAIQGELRAVAKVVHTGRTLIYTEARLYDSAGDLLALGTGSFTRSQLPLRDVPGYQG
ncbi:MAG: PaaI family thioesterase [Myxococcota bacterium]